MNQLIIIADPSYPGKLNIIVKNNENNIINSGTIIQEGTYDLAMKLWSYLIHNFQAVKKWTSEDENDPIYPDIMLDNDAILGVITQLTDGKINLTIWEIEGLTATVGIEIDGIRSIEQYYQ